MHSHGSLSTEADGSSGSRLKLDFGSLLMLSERRRRTSPAAMNTGSRESVESMLIMDSVSRSRLRRASPRGREGGEDGRAFPNEAKRRFNGQKWHQMKVKLA